MIVNILYNFSVFFVKISLSKKALPNECVYTFKFYIVLYTVYFIQFICLLRT